MVAEPIATAPNEALILEYYCACRWHQCCRFERAATSVRRRFMGRTSEKPVCPLHMGRLSVAYKRSDRWWHAFAAVF